MRKVEVELPDELLTALAVPASEIQQRTKEWIVLALFLEGEISAGKAAELLQMTKSTFIAFLDQRGLPYLDAAPGELAQDVDAAMAAVVPQTNSHEHGQ